MGQCLTASESVLPSNHGHLKGSSVVIMRVKPVLTFDANDKEKDEDTPLEMIRRSGNNSTPDPGPSSSSPNLNATHVFLHCVFFLYIL